MRKVEEGDIKLTDAHVNNLSKANHRFDTLLNPPSALVHPVPPLLLFSDAVTFTQKGTEECCLNYAQFSFRADMC